MQTNLIILILGVALIALPIIIWIVLKRRANEPVGAKAVPLILVMILGALLIGATCYGAVCNEAWWPTSGHCDGTSVHAGSARSETKATETSFIETTNVTMKTTRSGTSNHLAEALTALSGVEQHITINGSNRIDGGVGIVVHTYPQFTRVEERDGTNVTRIKEYGNRVPFLHEGKPPMQPGLLEKCMRFGGPEERKAEKSTTSTVIVSNVVYLVPQPQAAVHVSAPITTTPAPVVQRVVVTNQVSTTPPPQMRTVGVAEKGTYVAVAEAVINMNWFNKLDYLAPGRFLVPADWRSEERQYTLWIRIQSAHALSADEANAAIAEARGKLDEYITSKEGAAKLRRYYTLNNPFDPKRQEEFGKWLRSYAKKHGWEKELASKGRSIQQVWFEFMPGHNGTG